MCAARAPSAMNPSATTARSRSLAIMIWRRSTRSSSTPATGPGQDRRHGARQHDAAHDQARPGRLHDQAEHGDVVEVIADFADDLPGPGVAVIAVGPEELEKEDKARAKGRLRLRARSGHWTQARRLTPLRRSASALALALAQPLKNARACQESRAGTSHLPACSSATRESVLLNTIVSGRHLAAARALGKGRTIEPRDLIARTVEHRPVVHELEPHLALERRQHPRHGVDRAARRTRVRLVDRHEQERPYRRSRAAASGAPCAAHCWRNSSTTASSVSCSVSDSGRSAAKIQRRASGGISVNGTRMVGSYQNAWRGRITASGRTSQHSSHVARAATPAHSAGPALTRARP